MNVLSLFDGISCGMVALEKAGIKVDNYYASEIDLNSIKISKNNYPEIIQLGDVKDWKNWNIDWENIDLLIGGSPCQSLSITQSKNRKNLDGKSKLFFYYVDILNYLKLKNPNINFLFENVASMSKESKKAMEYCLDSELIYQNSNAFCAQDRARYYATNFEFKPKEIECDLVLKNILENNVDEKYFYNCDFEYHGDKQVCATLDIKGHDILKRVHSENYKCHTLTTCGGGNAQKKVFQNNRCRKLTPTEYERLQTLPDGYTNCVANIHRYNSLGNGWTVDTIAWILSFVPLNNEKDK